MRGFLIDPDMGTVEMVDREFQKLEELQSAVGGYIEVAGYLQDESGSENVVYCDEEGLLKLNLMFTKIDGFRNPLAGCLLVIGTTEDGDSCDSNFSKGELEKMVSFMSLSEVTKKAKAGVFA